MSNTSKFLTMAAVGLTAFAVNSTAMEAQAADDHEKCYGVVKAGKNDCGNASGTHSCAGQATIDGAGDEWVYLPKGICERLANGSTEPQS